MTEALLFVDYLIMPKRLGFQGVSTHAEIGLLGENNMDTTLFIVPDYKIVVLWLRHLASKGRGAFVFAIGGGAFSISESFRIVAADEGQSD